MTEPGRLSHSRRKNITGQAVIASASAESWSCKVEGARGRGARGGQGERESFTQASYQSLLQLEAHSRHVLALNAPESL
jgi:O-acetyl-ADP-ribose deacetylase (regulator of RNase III)